MKNILLYTIVGIMLLTISCKDIVYVTGVKLDPNKIEVEVGETKTLKATVQPSNATETTVYWYSESKNIVSVSSSGKITGIAKGTSRIRVSTMEGEFFEWCNVTVTGGGLNFDDITNSSYKATGKQLSWVPYPAPEAWNGLLGCKTDEKYYLISNWANSIEWVDSEFGLILYLDYYDGKLFLDDYTLILENEDGKNYYFGIGYIDGNSFYIISSSSDHEVKYDKTTRTLDFSGTHNGFPIAVALISEDKAFYIPSTAVSNAKLVLTPVSPAPPSLGNSMMSNPIRKSDKAGVKKGVVIPVENVK